MSVVSRVEIGYGMVATILPSIVGALAGGISSSREQFGTILPYCFVGTSFHV